MKNLYHLAALALLLCLNTNADAQQSRRTASRARTNAKAKKKAEPLVVIKADSLDHAQSIAGFAASDAWSMQVLGLWPNDKQQQMADWLFSPAEADTLGQPKGIALSMWRFNIGTGSAYQGEKSQINEDTRTESFLQMDGRYNWKAQAGQRSFLRLAKERGVSQFIAFCNSPHVAFTDNKLATNTGRGATLNLRANAYVPFAISLANVLKGLEQHEGIHFDYISPFNEPESPGNWQGPKQEGTPATKAEMAKLLRLLDKQLEMRKLNTQIIAPEAADYRCLWENHQTDWQRGHELASMMLPDSTDAYIANLPHFKRVVAAHSYWTTTPDSMLRACRDTIRQLIKEHDAHLWQTEVCIMQNDTAIGGGHGFDPTMKTALYVARIIHHDLAVANAESWQWWRAAGGNYKDGLLFYEVQNRTDSVTSQLIPDGNFRDSKLLWALGNYSRFVRPGATRLDFDLTNPQGLMVSVYQNARGAAFNAHTPKELSQLEGSTVVVAVNYGKGTQRLQLPAGAWQAYITSDAKDDNLRPLGTLTEQPYIMPARSIVTFVRKQ